MPKIEEGAGPPSEGDIPADIARDSEITTAVAAHSAASDPHTGYQKESEKGAAGGYAALDGSSRVAQPPKAHNHSASGDQGGTVAYSSITGKSVVDADVAADAAIAESKLTLASDAAAATASRRSLGTGAAQAAPGNDPLNIGFNTCNATQGAQSTANALANLAVFRALKAAGYAMTKVRVRVTNAASNVDAGVYPASGAGTSKAPTTKLATAGSTACPTAGSADITLSGSVTPTLGAFIALVSDSTSTAFHGEAPGTAIFTDANGAGQEYFQQSAFPLPTTPSSLAAGIGQCWRMMGV